MWIKDFKRKPGFGPITFSENSNYWWDSLLEVIRQNTAGWCQQAFCYWFKKSVLSILDPRAFLFLQGGCEIKNLVKVKMYKKECFFRNDFNSFWGTALELKGVIKFVSGGKNALSGYDKRRTHARQFKTDPCQYKVILKVSR